MDVQINTRVMIGSFLDCLQFFFYFFDWFVHREHYEMYLNAKCRQKLKIKLKNIDYGINLFKLLRLVVFFLCSRNLGKGILEAFNWEFGFLGD